MTIELRERSGAFFYHPPMNWMAETTILGGSAKAVGLGKTREEALTNLCEWLAGAATAINKDYEVPGSVPDA